MTTQALSILLAMTIGTGLSTYCLSESDATQVIAEAQANVTKYNIRIVNEAIERAKLDRNYTLDGKSPQQVITELNDFGYINVSIQEQVAFDSNNNLVLR